MASRCWVMSSDQPGILVTHANANKRAAQCERPPCSNKIATPKRLLTGWPRVSHERRVVREPSMDGHRRCSVEPRVESEFLQVVGETILPNDGGCVRAREWISDLQVVLTIGHLANVSPRRGRVHVIGIVHPFGGFMRQNHSVVCRREYAVRLEIKWRIGLERDLGWSG